MSPAMYQKQSFTLENIWK